MAYLLDILAPGLGHLASRRFIVGPALLVLWLLALTAVYVATSFDAYWMFAALLVHPLLVLPALINLWRLRRKTEKTKRPGFLLSLLCLPIPAVLLVVTGLFVTSQVVRPMTVRSGSMTPSVVTGDTILVQLFGPTLQGVHLGDIVLVTDPRQQRLLIKRILGMAGDLISIRGGVLHRNGRPLSQCTLRSLRDHETRDQVIERLEVLDGRGYLVWDQPAVRSTALSKRVPPGHLFVVGDNRDRSGDSRTFGTVPVESVRGLVTVRVSPVLTNRVYEAPLGARRAAFQRCSGRSSGGTKTRNSR